MKNSLSVKNDIYPLLKLMIPLALTGMVQSSAWFFETLFLAHLDEKTLAAGALVSWLFGTMAVILFGTLSSVNVLVAHKHGEKDQSGIALVARDGVLLAILCAIPAFILFQNMSPIFHLFGQSESVVALAKSYLQALSWGIPINFVTVACLEVIIGLGHARVILIFSILSVVMDIVCSYTLIFGKFGFSAYGIAGAGWGITSSAWMTATVLFIYITVNKKYHPYFYSIFKWSKPKLLIELLQIGLPMGFMYCVEVAFFFALTLVMGSISSELQAANQIALQYLGLMMSIMFSIAQAVTVRMGHLLGANEIISAKKAGYLGVGIAVMITSIIAIFYWLFPLQLISVDYDIHNPHNFAIIDEIKKFLAISAVFQIVESARIVFFGSLRGLKDTKFTLLTSVMSFWCIALPFGYVLATYFLGGIGFWVGMLIGASFSVVLLQWRFKIKINRLVAGIKG